MLCCKHVDGTCLALRKWRKSNSVIVNRAGLKWLLHWQSRPSWINLGYVVFIFVLWHNVFRMTLTSYMCLCFMKNKNIYSSILLSVRVHLQSHVLPSIFKRRRLLFVFHTRWPLYFCIGRLVFLLKFLQISFINQSQCSN